MTVTEAMNEIPQVRAWSAAALRTEGDVRRRARIHPPAAPPSRTESLFWDESRQQTTAGWIASQPALGLVPPHHWAPERSGASQPLQVHFDLKQALGLPEAVMTDNTIVFYEPVRPGDRLRTWQVLRSVSPEKRTKLGLGRFWVIDVEYVNQRGEAVGTESYTGFGYRRGA